MSVLRKSVRAMTYPLRFVLRKSRAKCRILGAKSPFFARLYYAIFSTAFLREQQSVLAGQAAYAENLSNGSSSSLPLLRRNTHRLEKGLLMRPRRELFALDYIEETVNCFVEVVRTRGTYAIDQSTELAWSRDVLTKYFNETTPHEKTETLRKVFREYTSPDGLAAESRVPYLRDQHASPAIAVDQLYQLARHRRSVRWFLEKPVPRELVDRAIEIAGQSPSACNRQPFVFRIIDEPRLLEKAVSAPPGSSGFSHNIPMMVILVGQQRNYFDERDRHLIYIDASLAAMSFIFGLEVQGLSSCCINWPDIEERELLMSDILELDADERPIMTIAVGFPDPKGLVAWSEKKTLQQIRRYNFE